VMLGLNEFNAQSKCESQGDFGDGQFYLIWLILPAVFGAKWACDILPVPVGIGMQQIKFVENVPLNSELLTFTFWVVVITRGTSVTFWSSEVNLTLTLTSAVTRCITGSILRTAAFWKNKLNENSVSSLTLIPI
jgi:hypothetical protein